MSAVIGALRVNLGISTADFEQGLKRVNVSLTGVGKAAAIGFAAVATAALAATASLGVAVKGAIDNADAMGEMAEKAGVTVEALSSLAYAAKLSGTDTDALSTSLRKLSVNMLAVAQGSTGPVAAAFKALGVNVQEADGALRSSDAVLIDVADKFSRMENGAAKTALAMQLFGKSGAELVPFLNQGRDGLAALTAEADRLGITLSTKTANDAGAFNDTLDRLGGTFDGVINQITSAVLPSLNQFGAKLADPQFAASAQGIGLAIVDGMKLAVDAINTVVGTLGALQSAMDSLGIRNKGAGFQKFNTVEEAKALLTEQLNAGQTGTPVDLYAGIFGSTAAAAADSAAQVAAAFEPVITNTQAAAAGASALKTAMSEGLAVFTATRTPAEAYGLEIERLNGLLSNGAIDQETFNRAVLQAQDAFSAVGQVGAQVTSTLQSGFADVFKGLISGTAAAGQAITGLLSRLGDLFINQAFNILFNGVGSGGGIGGFISSLFGGAGGGLKLGFNGIPGFASGGSILPGGAGGIDSQLVVFRKSPNERVDITKPGQSLVSGEAGGSVTNTFHIDARGAQRGVGEEIRAALEAYDSMMPQRVLGINADPRAR